MKHHFALSLRSVCAGLVLVVGSSLTFGVLSTAHAIKPLVTGVDATFAPHAMPKLGGGIDGFNVELGQALAKQLGTTITIEGTEFSALIPGMNAKKYDFVLAPTTVTEERSKAMLFSEGYLNTDFAFVVAKGAADMKGVEDLKGKTISVNKGSAYENWARDNMTKYGFKYDVYATNADAIQAVLSGRAYANMAGNTVAAWVAKQNPAVRVTYTLPTGLVWSLAFRLDDKAGRDEISMALKCLKKNGTVSKLAQKWFSFTPEAGSAAVTIVPGQGVPNMPGYDPKPVELKC